MYANLPKADRKSLQPIKSLFAKIFDALVGLEQGISIKSDFADFGILDLYRDLQVSNTLLLSSQHIFFVFSKKNKRTQNQEKKSRKLGWS